MEEYELVTHGHRHRDCLLGSVGGVSYGNCARSSTQGRQHEFKPMSKPRGTAYQAVRGARLVVGV